MNDLREIIAKNISELRTAHNMTQLALAQTLNYSDKAVSKWERAESIPDVTVLKQIADIFSVSVDYLLTEEHTGGSDHTKNVSKLTRRNRFIIAALATSLVWLITTFLFVIFNLTFPAVGISFCNWLVYIYAIPASAVVLLVFNSIWGKGKWNFAIISLFVWSVLLCVYLSFLLVGGLNIWLVFVLGIPAQVIIILWSGLRSC